MTPWSDIMRPTSYYLIERAMGSATTDAAIVLGRMESILKFVQTLESSYPDLAPSKYFNQIDQNICRFKAAPSPYLMAYTSQDAVNLLGIIREYSGWHRVYASIRDALLQLFDDALPPAGNPGPKVTTRALRLRDLTLKEQP